MTARRVHLGSAPSEERSGGEGLGACRTYLLAVRLVVGDEPAGASLRVVRTPRECERPYEVVCEFDPASAAAAEYAARCGRDAPSTWAAAGLTRPVDSPARVR